jgi:hypothetical protein
MFHMSLKYTHLLHVSTSLGHLQVTFFFQGIYRIANIVTCTLKVCDCIFIFGLTWCLLLLFFFFVLWLLGAPLGVLPLCSHRTNTARTQP